jgi:Ca2+-binding RTX toxin-like protein
MAATLVSGSLNVVTGDGADDVTVGLVAPGRVSVTENGVTKSFAFTDVKRIEVLLGGGNDKFAVTADRLAVKIGPVTRTFTLPGVTVLGGDGNDTITTGRGNDRVFGDNQLPRNGTATDDGNDVIDSRAGNDSLIAGGGNDKLTGGEGNDSIEGNDGNDVIDGGNGNDTMDGGDGGDTVSGGTGADGNDVMAAGPNTFQVPPDILDFSKRTAGINIFIGQPGASGQVGLETDTIRAGFVVMFGTRGNDHFIGTEAGDAFNGQEGDDLIEGRGGDDSLFNRAGRDTIRGGDGDDRLDSSGADSLLDGGAGNDNFETFTGNDTLIGGDGVDEVHYPNRSAPLALFLDGEPHSGQAGEKDLLSTDIERVTGGRGNDVIFGNGADNKLDGFVGNDTIHALEGNDQILGNQGDDSMNAGDGDDKLDGGTGADVFSGGAGTDTLQYSNRTDNLTVRPDGRPVSGAKDEKDTVFGDFEIIRTGAGNDTIFGTNNPDQIFAGPGNDEVRGLGGNDRLDGGDGNDRLIGGDGNDVLNGRAGRDTLYGQNGSDVLHADDSAFDYLFGGGGRDRFRADAVDRLAELEARL